MATLKCSVSPSLKKRLQKAGTESKVNELLKKGLKKRKRSANAVAGGKGSKARAANVPKKGILGLGKK